MQRLYNTGIFNPIAVATAIVHHFDGRRFAILAGGHHIRAGGRQGDTELVGAQLRTHAVRPYNSPVRICYFQHHHSCIIHRQQYVGDSAERVGIVL